MPNVINAANGIVSSADGTSDLNIQTGGTTAVAITSAQRVGIGAATPVARLDVGGNQAINIVNVAALDIDCSAGNFFTKTINGNSTFTFSNVPSSRAFAFTLELVHTSGSVTWPASVVWPNGNLLPSLTTGRTHLFTFVTDNNGTTWRAASQINYTS